MAELLTMAWLLPGVSIGDLWIAVVAVLSIGDLWIAVVAMLSIGLPNVVFWPPLFA